MASPFHQGERQVQERAGVRALSEKVGRIIGATIPPPAQDFLAEQPMLILGGADAEGRAWASMITGEPGFARATDERTLRIEALPIEEDPLRQAYDSENALGVLAIEPVTRRRMRLNGQARTDSRGLTVRASQVYANCPKYIQKRAWHWAEPEAVERRVIRSPEMSQEQKRAVETADTFFIASLAGSGAQGQADASHRGGEPGFVRADGSRLLFPDYAGNAMFNTLGNLQLDGRAGLLFWLPNGGTLQLSGHARVHWESQMASLFAGAERVVEFHVEQVVQIENATKLRWRFVEASPHNPKPKESRE